MILLVIVAFKAVVTSSQSSAQKTNYFVKLSKGGKETENEEYDWPEQDILVEVARQEDEKNRQEEIAKSSRRFWAEEILFSELWTKIKLRKELQKWARTYILTKLNQVIIIRSLLKDLANDHDMTWHDMT